MGIILMAYYQHPQVIMGLVMVKCVKLDECSEWLMIVILTKYLKVGWNPRSNHGN
jgi:hypothetical protein